MGRKASHVALECTLQSHPNLVRFSSMTLFYFHQSCSLKDLSIHHLNINDYAHLQVILGEEVAASKLTLFDLTTQICDAVQARAQQGLINLLFLISYLVIVFGYLILCIMIRQVPWGHLTA